MSSRLLLSALLCCALAGCAGKGASREEQKESLQRLNSWQLEQKPWRYFHHRTTLLARQHEDGHWVPAGTATAVSPDGYFLTSAHILDRGTPKLLSKKYMLPRLSRDMVEVRVVWADHELDLAVIHAKVRPRAWLELVPELPTTRAQVCSAGYVDGEVWVSLSAGHVELIEAQPESPPSARVEHGCPLRRGDSGGPVTDCQGRLLGINYLASGTLLGLGDWSGVAVWVDPAWLERLLLEDRQQVAEAGG